MKRGRERERDRKRERERERDRHTSTSLFFLETLFFWSFSGCGAARLTGGLKDQSDY